MTPSSNRGYLRWCASLLSLFAFLGCQPPAVKEDADEKTMANSAPAAYIFDFRDGHAKCPQLSLGNVDRVFDELHAQGVKRFEIFDFHQAMVPFQQEPDVIARVVERIGDLESLRLINVAIRKEDVLRLVSPESRLKSLSLSSCTIIDRPGAANRAVDPSNDVIESRLIEFEFFNGRLVVASGEEEWWLIRRIGTPDSLIAECLRRSPNLQSFTFGDLSLLGRRDIEQATGDQWPWKRMTKLSQVTFRLQYPDQMVRRAVQELANLKSLTLAPYYDRPFGKDWIVAELDRLNRLEIWYAENIAGEDLQSVVDQATNLQMLIVHGGEMPASERPLHLNDLTGLRELKLAYRIMGEEVDLESLRSLTQLESLHLSGLSAEALLPIEFEEFDELKQLSLKGRSVDFSRLSRLPDSLQSLTLQTGYGSRGDAEDHEHQPHSLGHLRELTELSITGGDVAPGLIETLPRSLQSITLSSCDFSNDEMGRAFENLEQLSSLELISCHIGYSGGAYEKITGAGWRFASGDQLKRLKLDRCQEIEDEFIASICQQLTGLREFEVTDHAQLTGADWEFGKLEQLESLTLGELPLLGDRVFHALPASLQRLDVHKCVRLTGDGWDLRRCAEMQKLAIQDCDALLSLGAGLPSSLAHLAVRHCNEYTAKNLDVASLGRVQALSLTESYAVDVDDLFRRLPPCADSLRALHLTGCDSVTTTDWDLTPLADTLELMMYEEAEPAYRGGLTPEMAEVVQRQLPDCVVFSHW
ncbi:MAG: hypothetical protein NXI28_07355 [bacterium]|nr:hypothetical protein [bacterium]